MELLYLTKDFDPENPHVSVSYQDDEGVLRQAFIPLYQDVFDEDLDTLKRIQAPYYDETRTLLEQKPLNLKALLTYQEQFFEDLPLSVLYQYDQADFYQVALAYQNNQGKLNKDWIDRFLTRLEENVDPVIKPQLINFLTVSLKDNPDSFQLDAEGNLIAYKGVAITEEGKLWKSYHSGTAWVNGKVYKQQSIPQQIGDVVTMPRHKVQADPNTACSYGLHAGTLAYAKDFAGNGDILKVKIHPEDIVSVPYDCRYQKIRTTKYEVLECLPKTAD